MNRVSRFVVRRLMHGVVLLLALSFLSFALAQWAPGDFYSNLRADPQVSAATVSGLRAQSGLTRPLPVRYIIWLTGLLHGDFGYSLAYHGPVAALLPERIASTLLLTATAVLLAWGLALPLGIWSAAGRRGWLDSLSTAGASLLLAIPELVLAIALLSLAVETGWLPGGGKVSRAHDAMGALARFGDVAWHMVIPVTVLVAGLAPVLMRHVRAALLETMAAPFALSTRAHGIPRRRILFRHLLPAALNPIVSLFGVSLGTLLSASLLVEVITGWPGLGPLFVEAIMARDFALVLSVVMLSAAFLLLGNLAADLLLCRIDPRIRRAEA